VVVLLSLSIPNEVTALGLSALATRQEKRKNVMKTMQDDPDMLEEYDFTDGVRGKYAERYANGTNVVVIDPDLAQFFPDNESVNEALRYAAG